MRSRSRLSRSLEPGSLRVSPILPLIVFVYSPRCIGVWISLTALPVYAINSIPRAAQAPLGPRDALAAAFWVGAFTWEVVADRQKSAWRERKNNKEHDETFISSGRYRRSRTSLQLTLSHRPLVQVSSPQVRPSDPPHNFTDTSIAATSEKWPCGPRNS
jgi:hypothetical protein